MNIVTSDTAVTRGDRSYAKQGILRAAIVGESVQVFGPEIGYFSIPLSDTINGDTFSDLEDLLNYISDNFFFVDNGGGGGGLSLGETSTTAYRGDRGKIAYDFSQGTFAPSDAQKNSDITKAEIEAKLTGNITTHTHTVTKSQVGLGNVDNTSDVDKPISTATKSYVDAGVIDQNLATGVTNIKFWTGTQLEYDAIDPKVANMGSRPTFIYTGFWTGGQIDYPQAKNLT